jgi:phosphotransferase system  glucose/maltose/N-acetylglucosamine-specific IIC component
MQRIALTMASLMMAPTMAFALPVTPLPGSADLEERPVGRQLLIESGAAGECTRSRDGGCVDLEMRIWSDRFGPLEDRAQKFQAQREALMASKGFLLSDEEPIIERLVEDAPIETPLPAAIFPMMLGLTGAALAMRLKKPAARRG